MPEMGVGIYDFHARMYDATLGRTFQLDPLADKFLDVSPYSWVLNNPLITIDPDGKEALDVFEEQNDGSWKRVEQNNDAVDTYKYQDGSVQYYNKESGEMSDKVDTKELNKNVAELGREYDQEAGEVLVSEFGTTGVSESTAKHVTGETNVDFITGSGSAGSMKSATPILQGLVQGFGALSETVDATAPFKPVPGDSGIVRTRKGEVIKGVRLKKGFIKGGISTSSSSSRVLSKEEVKKIDINN